MKLQHQTQKTKIKPKIRRSRRYIEPPRQNEIRVVEYTLLAIIAIYLIYYFI